MASGNLCKSCAHAAPGCGAVSSGVLGGALVGARTGGKSGVLAGRLPVHNPRVGPDPMDLRAMFPGVWSAWCRENFGNNPVQLAAAFRVSEKAARMWLAGISGPNGWAVAHAVATAPPLPSTAP